MGFSNAVNGLSLHNFLVCNKCTRNHCRCSASVHWDTLAWTGLAYSLL